MSLAVIKSRLPWWAKIGAKLLLSRLPTDYSFWQRLGLFRHGHMDTSGYALGVFEAHVARAGLSRKLENKVILELGPGDSIATAIIAYAHGARAVLVDVGHFARADLAAYGDLIKLLRARGLRPPELKGVTSLTEVLSACNARYLTEGSDSLSTLPGDSVDLIFSQAVLEHVRKRDFPSMMRECRRILRPNGVCSHVVDLKDHLGGGLNNLRFSEQLWESEFFARSGFYTNRIRFDHMLELFIQADFQVEVTDVRRWSALPIHRSSLAPAFRTLTDDALCVAGFDVLLRQDSETV